MYQLRPVHQADRWALRICWGGWGQGPWNLMGFPGQGTRGLTSRTQTSWYMIASVKFEKEKTGPLRVSKVRESASAQESGRASLRWWPLRGVLKIGRLGPVMGEGQTQQHVQRPQGRREFDKSFYSTLWVGLREIYDIWWRLKKAALWSGGEHTPLWSLSCPDNCTCYRKSFFFFFLF